MRQANGMYISYTLQRLRQTAASRPYRKLPAAVKKEDKKEENYSKTTKIRPAPINHSTGCRYAPAPSILKHRCKTTLFTFFLFLSRFYVINVFFILPTFLFCFYFLSNTRGVATGVYRDIYPPNQSTLNFLWLFCLLDPG